MNSLSIFSTPNGLLTTVAVALAVADAAGLAQGDTGGGAGPLAQRAPEARPGDGHHHGEAEQEELETRHVHTGRAHRRLGPGAARVQLVTGKRTMENIGNWSS